MSSEVIFEQATVGRNENCVALRRRNGEICDADIFEFGDENACIVAIHICEELDEGDFHDDNNVIPGEIGSAPCLFVFEHSESNRASIFNFDNKRDLNTAYQMALRFIEINNDVDDETADDDSDE